MELFPRLTFVIIDDVDCSHCDLLLSIMSFHLLHEGALGPTVSSTANVGNIHRPSTYDDLTNVDQNDKHT